MPENKKKRNNLIKRVLSSEIVDLVQVSEKKTKRLQQNTSGVDSASNWGFFDLENVAELEHTAAQRFISYKDHFINLTKREQIKTCYDLIHLIITHDETKAIAILKKLNSEFIVRQYRLDDSLITQEFLIQGELIKVTEVVQDLDGLTFCLPYYDSGIFKIRVFNTECDKIAELLDINQ